MQQSFFESSGGAGNWPCHADRIELRGNFMTASWDDWITAPLSITPSALCAVSSLLSLPLASLRVFHDVSFSFLHFSPLLRLLLARGSFINVTSLYRRVHKIQLSGCRDEFFFFIKSWIVLSSRLEMLWKTSSIRVRGDTVIEFNPFDLFYIAWVW